MNTKFLYCKRKYLNQFIETGENLGFRDSNALGHLENDIIRDDERYKKFDLPESIKRLGINGRIYNVREDASPKIVYRTRCCNVLCLSNDRDKKELYERFKADTCIEINVDKVINCIIKRNPNLLLIARNVKYYEEGFSPVDLSAEETLFYKMDVFQIENEYRIALFWPDDDKTVIPVIDESSGEDCKVKIFSDNPSHDNHIYITFKDHRDDIINKVYSYMK